MMEENQDGWLVGGLGISSKDTPQSLVNKILELYHRAGEGMLILSISFSSQTERHMELIEALVLFQEIYPIERLSKIKFQNRGDVSLGAWYRARAIEAFDFKHHIARPIQDVTGTLYTSQVAEWEACGVSRNSANRLAVLCSLIIEAMPEAGEAMTKQQYERMQVLNGIYQDVFASEEFNPVRNSMEDPGIPEYANTMLSELTERWLQYEGDSKETSGKDWVEEMSKRTTDFFSKAADQIKEVAEEVKAVFSEVVESVESLIKDAEEEAGTAEGTAPPKTLGEELEEIEQEMFAVEILTSESMDAMPLEQISQRSEDLNNLLCRYFDTLGSAYPPQSMREQLRKINAHIEGLYQRVKGQKEVATDTGEEQIKQDQATIPHLITAEETRDLVSEASSFLEELHRIESRIREEGRLGAREVIITGTHPRVLESLRTRGFGISKVKTQGSFLIKISWDESEFDGDGPDDEETAEENQ